MTAERRAYIIRIRRTKDGRMIGQLSDPAEGWRYPFRNGEELWRMIAEDFLASTEQSEARPASPLEGDIP